MRKLSTDKCDLSKEASRAVAQAKAYSANEKCHRQTDNASVITGISQRLWDLHTPSKIRVHVFTNTDARRSCHEHFEREMRGKKWRVEGNISIWCFFASLRALLCSFFHFPFQVLIERNSSSTRRAKASRFSIFYSGK